MLSLAERQEVLLAHPELAVVPEGRLEGLRHALGPQGALVAPVAGPLVVAPGVAQP